MDDERECAVEPPEFNFERSQNTDHIMEILMHLRRLAAQAGDMALARDLDGIRARAARRKRLPMN